jgi:acetoin utilization deacetylase AcuC-like enzyme
MKIFTNERCAGYSRPGHPERAQRIIATTARLRSQTAIPLAWAEPGSIDDSALLRAHPAEHLERLEQAGEFDEDTPAYPGIAELARDSAAAAVQAMRSTRKGEPGFSLMRPPGHHATKNRAMGFCYLSNIAIAALAARAEGAKRVAIYDFDVHHGNGTEAVLLNTPGVRFCSIHQFPCYPGTGTRNAGDNCFNYPVAPQTPRKHYREVLESALEHLLTFKPDLIGVSAGFDAYARDPLAQETLEREDFHWIGQQFRKAGIPVFTVLEGGYSDDLPELVLAYLCGLENK